MKTTLKKFLIRFTLFILFLGMVITVALHRGDRLLNSVVNNTITYKNTAIYTSADSVVHLNGQVNFESIEFVLSQLEELRKRGKKEVLLVISSPGGNVMAGMKLISYMNNNPDLKINTFCVDLCASMAAFIFQYGKKRHMNPSAVLMFHQVSGSVSGTSGQMQSILNLIIKLEQELVEYVLTRSGVISKREYELNAKDDWWITGREAVELNLTDGLAIILEQ